MMIEAFLLHQYFMISGVVTEFQNAIACAQRVFTLIDEEPQIPEPEHAVHLTDIDGNVKVEDVSFSYLPGQHLIEDFNLEVKPGQRIAIVGPTGCGKTTLIYLLMRFYDEKNVARKDASCNLLFTSSKRSVASSPRPNA